jgi:hypothetical protein
MRRRAGGRRHRGSHRHALSWGVALKFTFRTACLSMIGLTGCAVSPDRPAPSTVGCAEAVVAGLPSGLDDLEKHCLASAGITLKCSRFEAWLAGWGKEARDALGGGDASREDVDANRIGRRCANGASDTATLLECCRRELDQPSR